MGEDHREHDETHTGDTCRTDGGEDSHQDDREVLRHTEFYTVDIGDEDRGDPLHDGCSVHIDRSSEGDGEGGDGVVYPQSRGEGAEGDGDRGIGARGAEREELCILDLGEEKPGTDTRKEFKEEHEIAQEVYDEYEDQDQHIVGKGEDHIKSKFTDRLDHEGKDGVGGDTHDDRYHVHHRLVKGFDRLG